MIGHQPYELILFALWKWKIRITSISKQSSPLFFHKYMQSEKKSAFDHTGHSKNQNRAGFKKDKRWKTYGCSPKVWQAVIFQFI